MKTEEKYKEMGFTKIGNGAVQDRHGDIYFPRKVKGPAKAIRRFCFECMGMDRRKENPERPYADVESCTDPVCPLFDFRAGRNPFHARALSAHEPDENQQEAQNA